jgi:hypothetical protein
MACRLRLPSDGGKPYRNERRAEITIGVGTLVSFDYQP